MTCVSAQWLVWAEAPGLQGSSLPGHPAAPLGRPIAAKMVDPGSNLSVRKVNLFLQCGAFHTDSTKSYEYLKTATRRGGLCLLR